MSTAFSNYPSYVRNLIERLLKIIEVRSVLLWDITQRMLAILTEASGQNIGRIFKGLEGICIPTIFVGPN